MEVGVRLKGSGIKLATALGDGGAEFVERGDVPIDDWLIHQRPEMLDRLSMVPLYVGFLQRAGAADFAGMALSCWSSASASWTSQMRWSPWVAMRASSRPLRTQR
jgi:hypothetical protein